MALFSQLAVRFALIIVGLLLLPIHGLPQTNFGQVNGRVYDPDFTYRTSLRIYNGSGAVPNMVMTSYQFLPNTLRVKSGTTVTIVNSDAPAHTITDDFVGGMDTGRMRYGTSVSIRFTVPGEFNFHCSIHPSMRGKIIVEE